jgi:conjugal transfer pilus assembly protein TraE
MNFTLARNQIENLIAKRNGYLLLAIGSLFICLIQLLIIFYMIGREKIIIVPPDIQKSFWVSATHASPEYLAEMTRFFSSLRFNVTAENVHSQQETLLRYTDPSYYPALKNELVQEADRIAEQHVSMVFFPVNLKIDSKHFKVMIEGDLKILVGDAALPTKRTSYLITYGYDAGRLLVKSFEEVVKHD